MTKIYIPPDTGSKPTQGKVSPTQDIGFIQQSSSNVQQSFGESIKQAATEYFNQTDALFKDTQYSNAMLAARKEFNASYYNKMEEIKKSNGNVDFKKLPEEIDAMSQEILNKHTKGIFDQGVNQKLTTNFNDMVGNKGLEALSTAAKLQEEFAIKSNDDLINDLYEQALADPLQAPALMAELQEAGQTAVNNNYKSQSEVNSMLRKVTKAVAEEELKLATFRDPEGTANLINEVLQGKKKAKDGLTSSFLISMYSQANTISNAKEAEQKEDKKELKDKKEEELDAQIRKDPNAAAQKIASLASDDMFTSAELMQKEAFARSKAKEGLAERQATASAIVKDTADILQKAETLTKAQDAQLDVAVKLDPTQAPKVADIRQTDQITKQLLANNAADREKEFVGVLADTNIPKEYKQQVKSVKDSIDAQISKDSFGYYLKHNTEQQVAPLDVSSGNLGQQLAARKQLEPKVRNFTGVSGVLATEDEMTIMVDTYKNSNVEGKLNMLEQINLGLGTDSRKMLAGFKQQGEHELAGIGQLVVSGKKQAAKEALLGLQARLDNPKLIQFEDGLSARSFYRDIEIDLLPSGDPSKLSDNMSAARNIFLNAKKNDPFVRSSDEELYKQAIEKVLGGKTYTFNGSPVEPVPGVSEDKFFDFLDSLEAEDIDDLEVPKDEFLSKLKQRDYQMISHGDGIYTFVETLENGAQRDVYKSRNDGKPSNDLFVLDYNGLSKSRKSPETRSNRQIAKDYLKKNNINPLLID